MSVPAYPDYKDTGVQWLGAIPRAWTTIPFGALFRRTKRVGFPDEELLSVYRDYGVIRKSDRNDNFNNASEDLSAYQLVECGDLAMNKMKAWQGSLGISPHRGIVSPAYFVFAPRGEFHPQFLHYLLRSPPYAAGYMTISKGIRINQWDVDPDHLSAMPVVLPSVDEQAAIAAFLDWEAAKIDTLVTEQERLVALLKEKRQAIISHAVTMGLISDVPRKDSGIEWLGEIPAHWDTLPLRAVANEPGTIFIDGDWIESKDISDEGIRYITTGNVGEGIYKEQGSGFITEETFMQLNCTEVFPNDVLISRLNLPIGRACEVPDLGTRIVTSVDNVIVRTGSCVVRRYLIYLLSGKSFFAHTETLARGTTMQRVSRTILGNIRICLPPVDEQLEIAGHLDQKTAELDQLTATAQSAITLLQERRAALISAAVTGKIDVRGMASQSNVVSLDSARPAQSVPSLRAVVGGLVIQKLGDKGRMAVMKGGYLAEAHCRMNEIGGRYQRYAAGPYDNGLIAAMERGAKDLCGIETIEPPQNGEPVTYKVPQTTPSLKVELETLVGEDRARVFGKMLSDLDGIGREGIEAVATTYAVWNDLIAAGKAADDDAVCNGVLNDWHEEKRQKFKRANLDHWLDWMRRNGFVPEGTAPRTDHQGSLFE